MELHEINEITEKIMAALSRYIGTLALVCWKQHMNRPCALNCRKQG